MLDYVECPVYKSCPTVQAAVINSNKHLLFNHTGLNFSISFGH